MPQEHPSISIREARSEDAPGILACLRAAFEDYRRLYAPAAFLDTVLTAETIQVRLAKMVVLLAANSSNEIAGTIAVKWSNRVKAIFGEWLCFPRGAARALPSSY